MSLEDKANRLYVVDHKGPHPEEYHTEIHRRLNEALGKCRTEDECRLKLVDALDEIGADICTPGSRLNKLLTRRP